jgi:hypothetical protein
MPAFSPAFRQLAGKFPAERAHQEKRRAFSAAATSRIEPP